MTISSASLGWLSFSDGSWNPRLTLRKNPVCSESEFSGAGGWGVGVGVGVVIFKNDGGHLESTVVAEAFFAFARRS